MTAGKSRKGFDIDLREGQATERALKRLLMGHGPLIEVKSEWKATSTGNVFLEFEQAGPPTFQPRPSGVAITVSHWWATAFMDGGDAFAYVIRKSDDIRALGRKAYREGRVKPGGDDDLYRGVLVPVEWLLKPVEPTPQSIVPAAPASGLCGVGSPDGSERCDKVVGHHDPHHAPSWVWPNTEKAS